MPSLTCILLLSLCTVSDFSTSNLIFLPINAFANVVNIDPRSATTVVECAYWTPISGQRNHVEVSHVSTRRAHCVLSTSSEQEKKEMWTLQLQVNAVSKTCLGYYLTTSLACTARDTDQQSKTIQVWCEQEKPRIQKNVDESQRR